MLFHACGGLSLPSFTPPPPPPHSGLALLYLLLCLPHLPVSPLILKLPRCPLTSASPTFSLLPPQQGPLDPDNPRVCVPSGVSLSLSRTGLGGPHLQCTIGGPPPGFWSSHRLSIFQKASKGSGVWGTPWSGQAT